jgi:endonuclease YncB( thermonuclease family)
MQVRMFSVAPLLMLALASLSCPIAAQDAPGSGQILVIDGDTIVHGDEPVRLIGCDAPEIFRAKCEQERERGESAARRLRELLAQSKDVRVDPKLNWRGKPTRDRYCRLLAWLRIDGKDACCILIQEGHAVPYTGRGKRIDWCDDAQIRAQPQRCLTRLAASFSSAGAADDSRPSTAGCGFALRRS